MQTVTKLFKEHLRISVELEVFDGNFLMTIATVAHLLLIVWQNIALALGVKIIVLILGAGGIATISEAIFTDVGVSILAIIYAMRIMRTKDKL